MLTHIGERLRQPRRRARRLSLHAGVGGGVQAVEARQQRGGNSRAKKNHPGLDNHTRGRSLVRVVLHGGHQRRGRLVLVGQRRFLRRRRRRRFGRFSAGGRPNGPPDRCTPQRRGGREVEQHLEGKSSAISSKRCSSQLGSHKCITFVRRRSDSKEATCPTSEEEKFPENFP